MISVRPSQQGWGAIFDFKSFGLLRHAIEKKRFPREGTRVIDKREKTIFK